MADEPDLPIAQRGDIDWRLLACLLSHSVITHICIGIVRVTTSYRTVELGLPVLWLGVISAAFAILPVFMAVGLGRFIDRGNDALAAWIGAALILIACAGFWSWPASGPTLLGFTIFLGVGHMFCMGGHQMLAVRAANARGREAAFGHYMVAASIGQGLGPYLVGWIGGASTVPPTGDLFALGLIAAIVCFAVALTIRPAPRKSIPAVAGQVVPVGALFRLPGMAAFIAASVVTVTSLDLLVIYLPLLGTERDIDANAIGLLLAVRSAAALVGRLFYARLIYTVGRKPLTLSTIFLGAVAFALLAVPSLPVMYVAVIVLGAALGIASTTTMTGIIALAPAEARATALSLRMTGNRVGQVLLPFVAGVVAAATGVGGILVAIAVSLAASGTAVLFSRRQP
jgi:MFS family permease